MRTLSLRWRLVLTVSVVIALVLSLESILEIRLFEKSAERDLRETGLVTAEAVVDDLELRRGPWVPSEIEDGLREFARGVPSIRAISLVRLEGGAPTVVASTASSESDQALALARETIVAGDQGWRDDGALTRLALRTSPGAGGDAAVVVTLSLAPASQLRARGRLVSLWLVPLAIVVLTLVLDQALRRLVYRPVAAIRQTMARAGAGELAARVEVMRPDEMGEVATGLNQMLERLADFNLALEDRIRTVTSALDRSHTERIDSYQRMLALRDALARGRTARRRRADGGERGAPGRDAAQPDLRPRPAAACAGAACRKTRSAGSGWSRTRSARSPTPCAGSWSTSAVPEQMSPSTSATSWEPSACSCSRG